MDFVILSSTSTSQIPSGEFRPSDKGGGGGGGGGSHPDPEKRGRPSLQKKFFWSFGPQFGLKIRGAGPSPGSTTDPHPFKDLKPEKGRSFYVSVKRQFPRHVK